jgi:nicotinamidase-related amidase
MTTLADRPNTALVVIDVQRDVVAHAHRRDDVVARIAALVETARGHDVPVVWVQHADEALVHGSEGWEYVTELVARPGEPVVHKGFGDSFEATTLESELAIRAVGRVVIVGAQTDACIRSTLHGAFVRGYDTVLVADAHTTEDTTAWGMPSPELIIAHTNMYWSQQAAPGRVADVVDTEVAQALLSEA